MEKRVKLIITFIFMIFLVTGMYFFSDWFSKTTGFLIEDEGEETTLARCLTEKGARLYTANKCSECEKQKDIFGNGFRYIKFEECNGHPGTCQEIRGVPVWEINGEFYYGVRSMADLRILSGCG